MANREIPHYHTVTPKSTRPREGVTYRWYLGDEFVYVAEVTQCEGSCWATVRIIEPAPAHRHLYAPGATLKIKFAHYRFEPTQE